MDPIALEYYPRLTLQRIPSFQALELGSQSAVAELLNYYPHR